MRRRHTDDRLARLPIFRGCTDRELNHVRTLTDVHDVASGHVIVREGELTSDFYLLVTGRAAVSRGSQLLATVGPGEYFGELASLDPAPRNATVTMVTEGTLLILTRQAFDSLLTTVPGVARRLLNGLARRVHELDLTKS